MSENILIARVRPDEESDGTLIIASPVVGMADGAPRSGVFINPLDRVIAMKILNRRYVLRLPRDSQGRVTEVFIPNEFTPVAFDQPLARLDPRASEAMGPDAGSASRAPRAGSDGGEADLITIASPSEGIFYRRSSPDLPAYVELGAEVPSGTVLGLVEVMKCFNQITYGGPDLPARGTVAQILAEDAAEVQFGQALFRVKPAE